MLAAGTTLGPYKILATLGAGGMGEVYRARDTRLGREVAVKVIVPHLAASPPLRARFEREARIISKLNHPHICTLHDVGHQEEGDYLVMELLEGETLAHRLEKGPLPAADALSYGIEIADALDAAHRAGVVHRDLKPGNVMLTASGAKLMDFGLACAAPISEPDALTTSPTRSATLTAEGTLLGTLQYMAPEQLEGKDADVRTDLWALGCVLYQMATGKPAFAGASRASLLSAIMKDEPRPIAELTPLAPPALEHVVRFCLAKQPVDRWQSARDVLHELEWIRSDALPSAHDAAAVPRQRGRERLAWAVAAAALIATAGLGWLALRSRPAHPEAIQAIVDIPREAQIIPHRASIAISPDGRRVAFAATDSAGVPSLWIRPLDSDVAEQIPNTQNAWTPFWSPDGRDLAFFDREEVKLKKVAIAGGSPITICNAVGGRGGTWNRDGVIVFAPSPEGPLARIASGGGDLVPVTTLDSTRRQTGHRFPCFLPDGDHFLFAALPAGPYECDIYVGSLRSREVKRLLTAASAAVYAEPGYLLFQRERWVMAQPFDLRRLALTGDAVPIAEAPKFTDVDADPIGSVSRNGRLALMRSAAPERRLALLDRTGAVRERYRLAPGPWRILSVSPDGRRALVANGSDLWIVDLVRSVPMRFAATSITTSSAVWSPDGRQVAYVAEHAGREEIYIAGPEGRGEIVPTTKDAFKTVLDWSRDGHYLVFAGLNAATRYDIWLLPLAGDRKPVAYLRSPAHESSARVSPDGRWLAYSSDETGRFEVYVQSFPHPGRKVRVSADGGFAPAWAKDGRELLFSQGLSVKLISTPVSEVGQDLRIGAPHPLFTVPAGVTSMAVFTDGERFLASLPTEAPTRGIRVILDWQALIGKTPERN